MWNNTNEQSNFGFSNFSNLVPNWKLSYLSEIYGIWVIYTNNFSKGRQINYVRQHVLLLYYFFSSQGNTKLKELSLFVSLFVSCLSLSLYHFFIFTTIKEIFSKIHFSLNGKTFIPLFFIYILKQVRPTDGVYFTCDFGYYFLYDLMVCFKFKFAGNVYNSVYWLI